MSTNVPRAIQEVAYARWAQEYLQDLPPEHFMEATAQAHQREITVEHLALVKAHRPEVQYFNELLVQYPRRGQRKPGQVVPDNMVVITDQPIRATTCYNVHLEPARPFWVIEYVSKESKRKDYEDSFNKYERDLKVPYHLIFYPEDQELTLYHHNKRRYVSVKPNEHGRYAIPELDLEVGLHEGWVRFWYQGQLLPLPVELQRQVNEFQRQLDQTQQQLDQARDQLGQTQDQLDQARREAEAARHQAEEAQRLADELKQRLAAAEKEMARLRAQPKER
jgi:Uma2 family endonuclease